LLEAVIFAGVSTLLYHLGMGFLFFLVPLQAVRVRRGRRSFFVTMGLAFGFILAVKLVSQAGAPGASAAPFLLMETFEVLVLMAGLATVQLPGLFPELSIPPLRRVTRLVLVTGLAGLISVPVILHLRDNETFNAGLLQVFDSLAAGLQRSLDAVELGAPPAGAEAPEGQTAPGGPEAPGSGAPATSAPAQGPGRGVLENADTFPQATPGSGAMPPGPFSGAYSLARIASSGRALMEFVGVVFWRFFLFSYFLLVGLSWWLGSRLGIRFPSGGSARWASWRGTVFGARTGRDPGVAAERAGVGALSQEAQPAAVPGAGQWPRVLDFRLPDTYIWPLIGSLAVVLIGLMTPLGVLDLVAWNLAAIVLFLYGVSGIGVLQFFLRKFRVPRGMRVLLAIMLGVLLLSPRANLAVIILVPGLGVSEIWLRYRTRERSNG
jgi:hypothetical protein